MYDLLVKNGRIIDGTGSASYTADVAVAGGELVATGERHGEPATTLVPARLAVSPGLIANSESSPSATAIIARGRLATPSNSTVASALT